jgi:phage tail-like protein
MPSVQKVHDPAVSFRFEVSSGNRLINAGFSKVGGLKEESDVIEYREGSDPTVLKKIPGLRKYDVLTCERGMTAQGKQLVDWRTDVINCVDPFRDAVEVTVKNCDGEVARTITFQSAWPSSLELSDLDAKTSEVNIELLALSHEGRHDGSIFA